MTDKCSVKGCLDSTYCRSFCRKHYKRWWRGLDVNTPSRLEAPKGTVTTQGYRAFGGKLEHRLVAEKVLGRPLKEEEIVHHHDENRLNNTPSNLVICPSHAYHFLLHQRMRALEACGHADWRLCQLCGKYSPQNDPDLWVGDKVAQHRSCGRLYQKARKLVK